MSDYGEDEEMADVKRKKKPQIKIDPSIVETIPPKDIIPPKKSFTIRELLRSRPGDGREKLRYGVFQRIGIWFCDRLGVVPVCDFDVFFGDVDRFLCHSMKRFEEIDNFARAQSEFDKRVALILHLDKEANKAVEKELDDKGVYG